MKKLLYILIFVAIFYGFYSWFGSRGKDEIVVVSPRVGEEVFGEVLLLGRARGPWYFEASAPVKITDEEGNVLGQSYVTAQGEWMTEEFVDFKGSLSYEGDYKGRGFVIFMNDNPSGDISRDKSFSVPVVLQ